MTTRAPWLADVLRAAGCPVVEYRGWRTRGRDFADLRAVVWHHDASPPGDSPGVPAYMIRQIDAGKPGAQLWVDRKGAWHVLAAGVAYHAGKVRPGMPGNSSSLGVETDHTGGEKWPAAQVSSLRRGSAAILRHLGRDETGLHMHKSICDPVGRKTDPDGLDLALERMKVAELLRVKAHTAAAPTPIEDEMKLYVFTHQGLDWGTDLMVRRPFEDQAVKATWIGAVQRLGHTVERRDDLTADEIEALPAVGL